MTKITYNPQEGDPREVEWAGRIFKAGEAQDFDGRTTEHKAYIETAKGNPFFSIDGEAAQGTKAPKEPSTPEEYRAYAIDWINSAKSSREMERRWGDEEKLRSKVGWGSDDQALIDPLYEPKLENLKRFEDAS